MTTDTRTGPNPTMKISGYRYLSAKSCPRALVGIRHQPDQCWCEASANDHGGSYRSEDDGARVVIWQPYGVYGGDLARVLAGAEADGLEVHITGDSPWYPGWTVAITFSVGDRA